MTVYNSKIFKNINRGASITEVLLAMAIVAMAAPFVYSRIAQTNNMIRDIAYAKKIMSSRDNALNFIRMNQDKWPDIVQIRLDSSELYSVSPNAVAGFIDKYNISGAVVTDVYLAFNIQGSQLRANQVAGHIGGDAAVVGEDGIAYGNTWAVSAPDFSTGDLIYRISRDIEGEDTSKYLHRATSGEDDFNIMMRDLDMANHHIYNVATVFADSVRSRNTSVRFLDSSNVTADSVYFSSGANMNGQDVKINDLRVSGDTYGFRNIYADNLNGRGYTTKGSIITDRATITGSINVANNLALKSESARTINGFTAITAGSVVTSYVSCEEMMFSDNFGLTVSGELLMSSTAPLRIGNWSFPSTKPPAFKRFELIRSKTPAAPIKSEFDILMQSGWQTYVTAPVVQ